MPVLARSLTDPTATGSTGSGGEGGMSGSSSVAADLNGAGLSGQPHGGVSRPPAHPAVTAFKAVSEVALILHQSARLTSPGPLQSLAWSPHK